MEPKDNSIELSMFLKSSLTEMRKAPSQMFYLVLNIFCEHNFTFNIFWKNAFLESW